MKIKLLLLVLLLWQAGFGQISVSSRHVGKLKKIKKENFQRFKKTTTVFILSDCHDVATYDSILKASWHVTPYKIVKHKDFNLNDYLGNQYSYVALDWYKSVIYKNGFPTGNAMIHPYVDFYTYNFDKIRKTLSKMSDKKRAKKIVGVFNDNTINIARFLLYPNGEFGRFMVKKEPEDINKRFYSEDVFINYKPGFLKNYFQKISNLIQKEQNYWMYEDEYLPELKNLAKKTLYVPDFVAQKYMAFTGEYKKPDKAYLDKMFKKYEFKYQMISSDELNKKIMSNEPIYYLMYVRLNGERFISVVNAKTGEVVYRAYHKLGYELKSKHISKLNKAILKASKK